MLSYILIKIYSYNQITNVLKDYKYMACFIKCHALIIIFLIEL